MFQRRYHKCYCQKKYNEKIIENVCNNVGVAPEYKCNYKNNFDENLTCSCEQNNCGCGFDEEVSGFPENPMLGQSYVPIQEMKKTFVPCVGLKMGTIFPELVSPYMPCQSIEENAFIKAKNEIGEGCNK